MKISQEPGSTAKYPILLNLQVTKQSTRKLRFKQIKSIHILLQTCSEEACVSMGHISGPKHFDK